MHKSEAGRLGGLAVAKKYGSSYMQELGRKGANRFWELYSVQPVHTSGWAIVDKKTNKIIRVMSTRGWSNG